MDKNCPSCKADLSYVVDGNTYSKIISVEIRGVYDGGLFYLCPVCDVAWHRWQRMHYLWEKADPYVRAHNARTDSLPSA